MKKILPLLILIVLASSSFGQFWKPKAKATPTPSKTTVTVVEKSKNPIQEAKVLVKELQNELTVAKTENTKLKNNITQANEKVKKGFVEITKLNEEINALKEWGVIQQAEAQKFMEKYNSAVKRYHRLKIIAAMIAAAGGVLLGLQFMNLAPPPYNLGIPVGGAALFAFLVWIFL